jgi:calcineurin-like phosphoesterase
MNLNINQLTLSNNVTTNIYRIVRAAGRYFTAIGTTGKDTFVGSDQSLNIQKMRGVQIYGISRAKGGERLW